MVHHSEEVKINQSFIYFNKLIKILAIHHKIKEKEAHKKAMIGNIVLRGIFKSVLTGSTIRVGTKHNFIKVWSSEITQKQRQFQSYFVDKQRENFTYFQTPRMFYFKIRMGSFMRMYKFFPTGKAFHIYIDSVNDRTFNDTFDFYPNLLKRIKGKYNERELRKNFRFVLYLIRLASYYNHRLAFRMFYNGYIKFYSFDKPKFSSLDYYMGLRSKEKKGYFIKIKNNDYTSLKENEKCLIYRFVLSKTDDCKFFEIKNMQFDSAKNMFYYYGKIPLSNLKKVW